MTTANANKPIDRSTWLPGPWMAEPDRVEWKDEATGLPCLVVRHPSSFHLCGYVAVPPGHPLHGVDAATDWRAAEEHDLRVHGGVTYSRACQGDVCHVPAPGEPDDVWWIGFDAAHYLDHAPLNTRREYNLAVRPGYSYKTVDYMRAECVHLAAQLAAIGAKSKKLPQPEGHQ